MEYSTYVRDYGKSCGPLFTQINDMCVVNVCYSQITEQRGAFLGRLVNLEHTLQDWAQWRAYPDARKAKIPSSSKSAGNF